MRPTLAWQCFGMSIPQSKSKIYKRVIKNLIFVETLDNPILIIVGGSTQIMFSPPWSELGPNAQGAIPTIEP